MQYPYRTDGYKIPEYTIENNSNEKTNKGLIYVQINKQKLN